MAFKSIWVLVKRYSFTVVIPTYLFIINFFNLLRYVAEPV